MGVSGAHFGRAENRGKRKLIKGRKLCSRVLAVNGGAELTCESVETNGESDECSPVQVGELRAGATAYQTHGVSTWIDADHRTSACGRAACGLRRSAATAPMTVVYQGAVGGMQW